MLSSSSLDTKILEIKTNSLSFEALLAPLSEVERAREQQDIDLLFDSKEQSALWSCLNDKVEPWIHTELNRLIRRRLSTDVPSTLWRGISRTTLKEISGLGVGEVIELNRVTSFAQNETTPRMFANPSHYGTKTIFQIDNCPLAYCYQFDILRILRAAPDDEFHGHYSSSKALDRKNKIKMILDEQEWMLPAGTKLLIKKITEPEDDIKYSRPCRIYHLELVSI